MFTTSTPAPAATRTDYLRGARAFLPLAISIAAYGVVWGVLAGQAGLGVIDVLLMSGLVFAGASQFVALDMWSTTALPVASIVVATAIVNLRMALMSATMRPLVAGLPRWRAVCWARRSTTRRLTASTSPSPPPSSPCSSACGRAAPTSSPGSPRR